MKVITCCYAPPPQFGCAKVFVENLQKFPAKHELMLFSEHDWTGMVSDTIKWLRK